MKPWEHILNHDNIDRSPYNQQRYYAHILPIHSAWPAEIIDPFSNIRATKHMISRRSVANANSLFLFTASVKGKTNLSLKTYKVIIWAETRYVVVNNKNIV